MIQATICPHGVDLRFAKCLMCDDPAFHAARQPTAATNTYQMPGPYAPTPMSHVPQSSKEQLAREAYERWHQGGPAFDSITAKQWCSGYMSAVVDGRRPSVETNGEDGYKAAFYQIAELLGMTAMPISPKEAFETVMLPRLRELVAVKTTSPRPITEREGPHCPTCECGMEKS